MEVKVITRFRDAHTGEIHKPGETFECTQERYDEILAVGPFVEKVARKRRTRKKPAEE